MPVGLEEFTILRGSVALVKGPASITPHGELSILGIRPRVNEKIVVRSERILPLEPENHAVAVSVLLGEGSSISVRSGGVGVAIWAGIASEVLQLPSRPRNIMIIGATDSGKSTLATFLLNSAIASGMSVAVLDCDLGQGDLAPPGGLGLAFAHQQSFDLRDLMPEEFAFVGATSPRNFVHVVVDEVGKLYEQIPRRRADLVLINTDGYVREEGPEYKARLIKTMAPDIVVCIEDSYSAGTLAEFLKETCPEVKLMVAAKPAGVSKSHHSRLSRRLSQYRRFLEGARRFRIDMRRLETKFLGIEYRISGEELDSSSASLTLTDGQGRSLEILGSHEQGWFLIDGKRTVLTAPLQGMLVALTEGLRVRGFGLIHGLRGKEITLSTSCKGTIEGVTLSSIRLSRDMKEEHIIPVIRM